MKLHKSSYSRCTPCACKRENLNKSSYSRCTPGKNLSPSATAHYNCHNLVWIGIIPPEGCSENILLYALSCMMSSSPSFSLSHLEPSLLLLTGHTHGFPSMGSILLNNIDDFHPATQSRWIQSLPYTIHRRREKQALCQLLPSRGGDVILHAGIPAAGASDPAAKAAVRRTACSSALRTQSSSPTPARESEGLHALAWTPVVSSISAGGGAGAWVRLGGASPSGSPGQGWDGSCVRAWDA